MHVLESNQGGIQRRRLMPYTVPLSFDRFLENISLTGDHEDTAETRRKSIVEYLEKSFTITESFHTGSVRRDTALKWHADLDVIVVLHWEQHVKGKTPAQLLRVVRDALGEYKTNVRKNGQAVTMHYTTWPNVDIAPVSRTNKDDGSFSHYNVPDMNTGNWIPSVPSQHSANLTDAEHRCGTKLRPLVRMIKEWNRVHSATMQSFHIEAVATIICNAPIADFPWAVYKFFDDAIAVANARMPYGPGYADDYLGAAARREVVKRLDTARDRARDAWYLTYAPHSDHKAATEIWRQVFGDRFPAYG